MSIERTPTLLDDLYVGEEDDITIPCAKSLHAGEVIVSAAVTCSRLRGEADDSAASLVSTPCQVVGTDVVQRVTGQKHGVWYLFRALVTLNSGRKLVGFGLAYAKNS